MKELKLIKTWAEPSDPVNARAQAKNVHQ